MSFREEFEKAKAEPLSISDKRGNNIFQEAKKRAGESKALELYYQADEQRLGITAEQHRAAYTYLALAYWKLRSTKHEDGAELPDAHLLFHFAGHAFREIGQLNRAADAYRRAGITSGEGDAPKDFGIRSLARAKMCYREIGEDDKADEAHRLEWDARRASSCPCARFTLWIWKVTSGYGTKAFPWVLWVLGMLAAFTICYQIMYWLGWLCVGKCPKWGCFTGAYYSVVTMSTLGYGDISPARCPAQLAVTIQLVLGYVFLGIGLTILGNKVIRR